MAKKDRLEKGIKFSINSKICFLPDRFEKIILENW